jgi:hypothetical protein
VKCVGCGRRTSRYATRCLSCHIGHRNRLYFAAKYGTEIADQKLRLRWLHRWHALMRRCMNQKDWRYRYYGGRGITVHRSLRTFDGFCRHIKRLRGWKRIDRTITLDRRNNDKGYAPGNLRLASWTTQNRNKRKGQCRV